MKSLNMYTVVKCKWTESEFSRTGHITEDIKIKYDKLSLWKGDDFENIPLIT